MQKIKSNGPTVAVSKSIFQIAAGAMALSLPVLLRPPPCLYRFCLLVCKKKGLSFETVAKNSRRILKLEISVRDRHWRETKGKKKSEAEKRNPKTFLSAFTKMTVTKWHIEKFAAIS